MLGVLLTKHRNLRAGQMDLMAWQTTRGVEQELLMRNVTDSLKRKKLADLYDYLTAIRLILSIIKNESSKDTLTRVKWLNLTSNQLLMLDITRVEKCNGLGRHIRYEPRYV